MNFINNNKVIGKLIKYFISEVCIKLVALCINWSLGSSSQLHKVGDPCKQNSA